MASGHVAERELARGCPSCRSPGVRDWQHHGHQRQGLCDGCLRIYITGKQLWAKRYSGPTNTAVAVAIARGGATVYVTGTSVSVGGGTGYAAVAYDTATGRRLGAEIRRESLVMSAEDSCRDEDARPGTDADPLSCIGRRGTVAVQFRGTGGGHDHGTSPYSVHEDDQPAPNQIAQVRHVDVKLAPLGLESGQARRVRVGVTAVQYGVQLDAVRRGGLSDHRSGRYHTEGHYRGRKRDREAA